MSYGWIAYRHYSKFWHSLSSAIELTKVWLISAIVCEQEQYELRIYTRYIGNVYRMYCGSIGNITNIYRIYCEWVTHEYRKLRLYCACGASLLRPQNGYKNHDAQKMLKMNARQKRGTGKQRKRARSPTPPPAEERAKSPTPPPVEERANSPSPPLSAAERSPSLIDEPESPGPDAQHRPTVDKGKGKSRAADKQTEKKRRKTFTLASLDIHTWSSQGAAAEQGFFSFLTERAFPKLHSDLTDSNWLRLSNFGCTWGVRNSFDNFSQIGCYSNAQFVTNPQWTFYGCSTYGDQMQYILSQSAIAHELRRRCGQERITANVLHTDRVCNAYGLRMNCKWIANSIRNQNFEQFKNPGSGKKHYCE